MEWIKHFPVEILYGLIAIFGGIARYLNSFANGGPPFRLSILFASTIAAGFSGFMFALLGESLNLPYPMPHIFAGLGGFFGEQTLKLMLEYANSRIGKIDPPPPSPPIVG